MQQHACAHQHAVAMAIPSSRQSITTADRMDISECHTLCPYLHISTRTTTNGCWKNETSFTVDLMVAGCSPVELSKVGRMQVSRKCRENSNTANCRAAC